MYLYLFVLSLDLSQLKNKETRATRRQKFSFIGTLLWALVYNTPILVLKETFNRKRGCKSFLHQLRNGMLNSFVPKVNVRQLQSMFPSTETVLYVNCKKKFSLTTETFDNGARLHWMGDNGAKKVILYSHGGGYGVPALDGHVIFLQHCVKRLNDKGIHTAVAFVDYGLSPTTKYPDTFNQAVECLRFVIGKGYNPSDIVIGGDSAGASICLAILSHIAHGHPDIAPLPLVGSQRLAGAMLLCPWTSLTPSCDSYNRNTAKDYICPAHVTDWAADFTTPESFDEFSQPLQADSHWWESVPTEKMLITGGSDEVLIDDIVTFGERIKEAAKGTDTELVITDSEVHIEFIMDAQLGLKPGAMAQRIWQWLDGVW